MIVQEEEEREIDVVRICDDKRETGDNDAERDVIDARPQRFRTMFRRNDQEVLERERQASV